MLVDLFNAELSPERYWQGPRSQKSGEGGREGGEEEAGGEGGGGTEGGQNLTLQHHRNDSAF